MSKENVWIDGCFDFFHHGHANAILQSKQYGKYLVAGVHSDEEIELNKGPTVMKLNERAIAIKYNKWVDKVVLNAPYVTDPKWMDKENCFWVVHGDDITTDANGNDCYDVVRKEGRLKLVKRTKGVSTTDLINIIMTKSQDHYISIKEIDSELILKFSTNKDGISAYNNVWVYEDPLQLVDLEEVNYEQQVLVYGSFDLFNPFHITSLIKLTEMLPNLVIGVLKDGYYSNVMNLNQRSLCVLQCSLVKNVIIGVDDSILNKFKNKINIELISNEFSYLKGDGIKNRILDNFEIYQKRQERKGVKMELESKMNN